MDAIRFDSITRTLTTAGSRRRALAAVLGGLVTLGTRSTDAKKKKGKKPALNAFGCVNVGGKCRGKDSICCSGVCKGKKGKKDKRKCVAHNTGGCTPERDFCVAAPAAAFCNPVVPLAVCMVTTGNAGFCGNRSGTSDAINCRACTKDKDCEASGFPLGSACVIIDGPNCGSGCSATGARACMPPGA